MRGQTWKGTLAIALLGGAVLTLACQRGATPAEESATTAQRTPTVVLNLTAAASTATPTAAPAPTATPTAAPAPTATPTAALAPTATPAPKPEPTTPPPVGDAAAGEAVFMANCTFCHPGGEAGVGPSLIASAMTTDEMLTQVRQGSDNMPACASGKISEEDLENLIAYIVSLKE